MAKTFISFLGAIEYFETRYYTAPDKSDLSPPMFYVQEAILRQQSSWGAEDQVLIFTTAEALERNYFNRYSRKGIIANDGLKSRLEALEKEGYFKNFDSVNIPNGYTEDEIWTVFKRIIDRIRPGDDVYMDITFGFRSLPMLALVLSNYAKAVKDVKVKAIYYGNYEAGRAEQEQRVKTEAQGAEKRVIEAPILDLRPFLELQEWTSAAEAFLDLGQSKPLSNLIRIENKDLADQLEQFAQSIVTNRGLALVRDIDIDSLKQQIALLQTEQVTPQLEPLLARIGAKLDTFKTGDIRNGLMAVAWCIEHQLVQQGYTLLQETLVSFVLECVFGRYDTFDHNWRTWAGAILSGIKVKNLRNKPESAADIEDLKEIENWLKDKPNLIKPYKELTGTRGKRNDINHAGFREGYATPKSLTDELSRIYNDVVLVLKRYNLDDFQ
ncbi:MAG: TIGR02221 family CRISPR-associated protein [Bacteroidia bacterium]|nr:TIGR02221 family CRISPR-associated protein [Bacteroidia bacterium]